MSFTIPGVTIDSSNAAAGTQLTAVSTVTGSFSAIVDSSWQPQGLLVHLNGVQWPDGKDAVATDNDTIQLTITVAEEETPETPSTQLSHLRKRSRRLLHRDACCSASWRTSRRYDRCNDFTCTQRRKNK